MSKKKEEDEENQAQNFYKKFTNQGPAYFGDLDEQDGKLLEFEMHAEEEGVYLTPSLPAVSGVLTTYTRMGGCIPAPTQCVGHAF